MAAAWHVVVFRHVRWRQTPIRHGVHSTPAGRGFMWKKEGYSWKQAGLKRPRASLCRRFVSHIPPQHACPWCRWEKASCGVGISTQEDSDLARNGQLLCRSSSISVCREPFPGAIWEQQALALHDGGPAGSIPKTPAGPGLLWKRRGGEWRQVPLPDGMRWPERPCDTRAGPGMRWFFRAARGDATSVAPALYIYLICYFNLYYTMLCCYRHANM